MRSGSEGSAFTHFSEPDCWSTVFLISKMLYYCPPAYLQALAQLAGKVMWRAKVLTTPTCEKGKRWKVEAERMWGAS